MKFSLLTAAALATSTLVLAQGAASPEADTASRQLALPEVVVTAQQREQKLLDVPAAIATVSGRELASTATRNLEQLADLLPGLNIRIQTPHRPNLSIRGLTSDEVNPTAQPRVSVYFNNIPTSRASMALTELYDMERVEVVKGPQGTLYGRGALVGAINFFSQKPTNSIGGYASLSFGSFNLQELQAAVNIPLVKNVLSARVAGIYSFQDGYVKNLSGGKNLNGKNTMAGRFSLAFTPSNRLRADLMASYQRDNNPGTAFMSKRFANAKGETDIFKLETSLDSGKTWYNKRSVLLSSLDVKLQTGDRSYLTWYSSFTLNTVNHHWDGDGSAAPAIDMKENVDANQLSTDLRWHFAPSQRLSGFAGISYWRENAKLQYWFGPNEQYFVWLYMLEMTNTDYGFGAGDMVTANGRPVPIPTLTDHYLDMQGFSVAMTTNHQEENNSGAVNQSGDVFADLTLEILPKLKLTAGIRGTYENFTTTNESHMVGYIGSAISSMISSPSSGVPEEEWTLENVFFRPTRGTAEYSKSFLSAVCRANLSYEISPDATVFAGYSRGRRPNVVQFKAARPTDPEVLNAEIMHSFEAGAKWNLHQRLWLDASAFYQRYSDFQVAEWIPGGRRIYDAGQATAYGFEATVKAALLQQLDMFGSYAYYHARFADKYTNDSTQLYAGNTFRLTPENSFTLGFNAKFSISRQLQIIFTPTYSWRSHIWFEDSNEQQPSDPTLARLEQPAYGLLNANLAFRWLKPALTLSLWCSNLTDEHYLIGAGNTGMMFNVPTYVPAPPRMAGINLRFEI
jgi:outer membrane receptor protein involved in Fe transport